MDIGIGEIVTIAIAMVGVIISVNFVLARYQDRLRRAELKRIEDQVYNHLPTDIKDLRGDVNDLRNEFRSEVKDVKNELKGDIKEIGAKLDQLIIHLIPKPKDSDKDE